MYLSETFRLALDFDSSILLPMIEEHDEDSALREAQAFREVSNLLMEA